MHNAISPFPYHPDKNYPVSPAQPRCKTVPLHELIHYSGTVPYVKSALKSNTRIPNKHLIETAAVKQTQPKNWEEGSVFTDVSSS